MFLPKYKNLSILCNHSLKPSFLTPRFIKNAREDLIEELKNILPKNT
jgi:hypothetical protein